MSNISFDDIGADIDDLKELPADEAAKKEDAKLVLEQEKFRVEIDGLKQDQKERKVYADKIYSLIKFWLLGLAVIIILDGFLASSSIFDVSDNVMLALIGGTTANVLGLFAIVINYLFKK